MIRSRTVNFLPPSLPSSLVLSRSRKDKLAIPERTVPPFYLHLGSFIFIFIFISAFRRKEGAIPAVLFPIRRFLFFSSLFPFSCAFSLSPSPFPLSAYTRRRGRRSFWRKEIILCYIAMWLDPLESSCVVAGLGSCKPCGTSAAAKFAG